MWTYDVKSSQEAKPDTNCRHNNWLNVDMNTHELYYWITPVSAVTL